jgi:DGQHR domain-containing protein
MNPYSLSVFEIRQKQLPGTRIFFGKIKVSELLESGNKDKDVRFKIHKWESNQPKEAGYQRFPELKRIEKIKNYIQVEVENPIFPTAVLVNARKPITFKPYNEKINDSCGEITVDQILYIIDGQHRIEAFKDMMENKELIARYGYMELPIIILSNFDYIEEVQQFFVINSRQKTIKTDLAQRIFLEIGKNDMETRLISEKDKWQIPVIKVIDQLNADVDSEWYSLIGLPDDNKDIRKERVISQNSFITSLKPFFSGAYRRWIYNHEDSSSDGKIILEQCSYLIDNYWKMISKVYPGSFENKKGSILFKTIGVYSLHMLLANYMANNNLTAEKKNIQKIMDGIKELLEFARDYSSFGEEFWKVGNKDALRKGTSAGSYSSSSGHNKIAMAILNKKKINQF